MNDLQEKEIAVRYFLGELSLAEQESVEEKMFVDTEYSTFLDEVETDLIDEYLRGELSVQQNLQFEKNYLVSERRHIRVHAAKAIWEKEKLEKVSEIQTVAVVSSPTFWEQLKEFFRLPSLVNALSALVILLIGGAVWLGLQNREKEVAQTTPTPTPIAIPIPEKTNLPTPTPEIPLTPTITPVPQIPPTQKPKTTPPVKQIDEPKKLPEPPKTTPQPQPTPEREKPKVENPPTNGPNPFIALFVLIPSERNGENKNNFVLKPKKKTVRLTIKDVRLSNYNNFNIELLDENGTMVLTQTLKPKKSIKSLNIQLPAQKLPNGTYVLKIIPKKDGEDFDAIPFNYNFNYNFNIQRK